MQIQRNVPLKDHSTFQIGGEAEFLISISSREELRDAIRSQRENGDSWRVIGKGSNVLFGDSLLKGLTIQINIQDIVVEERMDAYVLHVGAGVILDDLVAYVCDKGWWGLENLSHIPGTVGATPIQNVGAYGVEVANLISSVSVYDVEEDAFLSLSSSECAFGYRHSLFKEERGKKYVIYEVLFTLPKDASPKIEYRDLLEHFKDREKTSITLMEVRQAVIAIRSKKFPDWHIYGTAGSFFKNPIISKEQYVLLEAQYPGMPGHEAGEGKIKVALGWVLEHVCHLKGVREGNVGTYEAQALVVVNYGNATAEEVLSFSKKIIEDVKEKLHIEIEYEVTYIAE